METNAYFEEIEQEYQIHKQEEFDITNDEYMENAIKFAPWAILSSIRDMFKFIKEDKNTKSTVLALALFLNQALVPMSANALQEEINIKEAIHGQVTYGEFVQAVRNQEVA